MVNNHPSPNLRLTLLVKFLEIQWYGAFRDIPIKVRETLFTLHHLSEGDTVLSETSRILESAYSTFAYSTLSIFWIVLTEDDYE